jgi:ribosomal protein S12 methylthiotransferase
MDSIMRQARHLIEIGVKELVLVGQDTTAYGLDTGRNLFADLLRNISKIEGDFWIRVLYAHPKHLTDENIEALTTTQKVAPYLDLPIQHISKNILEKMGRKVTSEEIITRVKLLINAIPDIALRTSIIVGFPGETDEDFEEIASYLEEGDFTHGGVFAYSKEEGTPASEMDGEIPKLVVETRKELLDVIFDKLRAEKSELLQGRAIDVLVESGGTRSGLLWGRTIYDAPQIDRMVRFKGSARIGEIVKVMIIKANESHLLGVQE